MKKILMAVAVLFTAFTAFAQERNFESTPIDVIYSGWHTKPITNVVNGSLGVMFERFDQTWPTWMGREIRNTMKKGLDREVLDTETTLVVTVDTKNGYASIDDAGTDGESMSLCYWNRTNGHKLFAVRIGKPTDPNIEFICFYDYNPQTKSLTPEPDILKGYRWGERGEYVQMVYRLPKVGKDVIVDEWGNEGPVRHTFKWNGMKPVYSKSESFDPDDDLAITVNYKGNAPDIKDFVNAFLYQPEPGESINSLKQSWELFLNGMNQIPGEYVTLDRSNGYACFESVSEESKLVVEFCYWNYADKKHKLLAVTNDFYMEGAPVAGQYTGIDFYLYDNATHKMKPIYAPQLGIEFEAPAGADCAAHSLPRVGKTLSFIYYTKNGKVTKRFTWNGSKFVSVDK